MNERSGKATVGLTVISAVALVLALALPVAAMHRPDHAKGPATTPAPTVAVTPPPPEVTPPPPDGGVCTASVGCYWDGSPDCSMYEPDSPEAIACWEGF